MEADGHGDDATEQQRLGQDQLSIAPEAEPVVVGDQRDHVAVLGGVDADEDVGGDPILGLHQGRQIEEAVGVESGHFPREGGLAVGADDGPRGVRIRLRRQRPDELGIELGLVERIGTDDPGPGHEPAGL